MERPDRASKIVSRTFFISQLIAISLVGLSAAAADLAASDLLPGILTIAAVLVVVAVVWGFRLPATFANRLSPGALSFGAILFSVFAVGFSYVDASGYADRPEAVLARPVVQILRAGSVLALAAFTLALLANVIAAVFALRARRSAEG